MRQRSGTGERVERERRRGREWGAREGESGGGKGNAFAKLSSIHFGSSWEVSKIDRSIAIDGLATTGLDLSSTLLKGLLWN